MSISKLEHKVALPTGGSDESRRLRVAHGRQHVNLPAAERAVRDLLLASVQGVLRENAASRQEFFMLTRGV